MQTQSQKPAKAYAETIATSALATIKYTRWGATGVSLGAMTATIQHQVTSLWGIGMPILGALLIPMVLDVATFICTKVGGNASLTTGARRATILLMIIPVSISGTMQTMGHEALGVKLAYVAAVAMIPVCEIVALLAHKIHWAKLDAAERATLAVAETEDAAEVARQQANRDRALKAAAQRKLNAEAAAAAKAERAERQRERRAARKAESQRVAQTARTGLWVPGQIDSLEASYRMPSAPVSGA